MTVRTASATDRSPTQLIGESAEFLATMDHASALAALDRPLLIVGERGTGKEGVAERIHFLSSRWSGPFEKVNCAALNEQLLESELFGHEAGAFTGATRRHAGRFERAHGGTLFLDELGAASPRVQEQVLRVIEYGTFERLGGQQTLQVELRLIAATNEDLPARAAQGHFRADLLDRLAFDVVTLPPLRARHDDILLLAEHFAMSFCAELGREWFAGFSTNAVAALRSYSWPGNVRELRNVVQRSLHRHPDPETAVEVITFDPFASPWRPAAAIRAAVKGESDSMDSAPAADTATTSSERTPPLPCDFKAALRTLERSLLQQALEACRFNRRQAAQQLGLSYDQLRGYLRKHDDLAG